MAGLMTSKGEGQTESVARAETSQDGAGGPSQDQVQFVENGLTIIENSLPQFLKSIEGDGDPVVGLATSVAALVLRLEDSARSKGKEIPPEAIEQGGVDLLEGAAQIATEAGIHDFSEEDLTRAYLLAVDNYRVAKQERGELDQGAAKAQFDVFQQAEQEGRLDELLPGATEFAKQHGSMPQEPAQKRRGLMA